MKKEKFILNAIDGQILVEEDIEIYVIPFLFTKNEKSKIEKTMQYINNDRTESFDDYFPCSRKEKCNRFHVKNWLNIFVNIVQ